MIAQHKVTVSVTLCQYIPLSGYRGEFVAVSENTPKPHQGGEEEHGDGSQFQHFPETREFPGKPFRGPERGRSLVDFDDFMAPSFPTVCLPL